jgi:hypothetical protein
MLIVKQPLEIIEKLFLAEGTKIEQYKRVVDLLRKNRFLANITKREYEPITISIGASSENYAQRSVEFPLPKTIADEMIWFFHNSICKYSSEIISSIFTNALSAEEIYNVFKSNNPENFAIAAAYNTIMRGNLDVIVFPEDYFSGVINIIDGGQIIIAGNNYKTSFVSLTNIANS